MERLHHRRTVAGAPTRYSPVIAWLYGVDALRRASADAMALLGAAPEECPSEVVEGRRGVRLRLYGGSGPPVLLLPAPIKKHYIWDIDPEASVVRRALAAGRTVFLAEWSAEPASGYGLADCVGELLELVRMVHRFKGVPVPLIGHSLGGTLAAMCAAAEPEPIAALVLLEAPLHFGPEAGALSRWVASLPSAQSMFGANAVPGAYLSVLAGLAAPGTFHAARLRDLMASSLSPPMLRRHMRVERWTLDEAAIPARLFDDVAEFLLRRDAFQVGRLELSPGRLLGPSRIAAPLLAVIDPTSEVVPPLAVRPFHNAAASAVKLLLPVSPEAGTGFPHVTALVGVRAHAELWPGIFGWLNQVTASRPPRRGVK